MLGGYRILTGNFFFQVKKNMIACLGHNNGNALAWTL